MAAVHTGAAEEDAEKLRLSSVEDWIQGPASWFHLSSWHAVEHEEFRRVATDRCGGAEMVMFHLLHLWIRYDHEGVAYTNHGSGPERLFDVVVMPIHQGKERLRRAISSDAICRRMCSSNAVGEELLANRLGFEPEPSTLKGKRILDPESSTSADRQTLNSNVSGSTETDSRNLDPESSTMRDNPTLGPESSATRIDPLPHTSYRIQADALFRKNLTYQKRNWKTNSCMVCFPITLCVLLVVIQSVVNHLLSSEFQCGCKCVSNINGTGCTKRCGVDYSDQDQVEFCEVPFPQSWPAILQVPRPENRAVRTAGSPDLQDESCRDDGDCGCTILYTASNKTLADTLSSYLLVGGGPINISDPLYSLASVVAGTDAHPWDTLLVESAFIKQTPIQLLQNTCFVSAFTVPVPSAAGPPIVKAFECVPTSTLWLSSVTTVNDELYRGFRKGNAAKHINEFPVAYDFEKSNASAFHVDVWFNATFSNQSAHEPPNLVRVSRALNMASQAYLRFLVGPTARLPLLFEKEMPKSSMQLRLDFSSLLGPHFYMWVLGFLFPVVLTALVYEKQYHLRMMMKMHGLGDLSYWTITYIYFLVLFVIYMFCFILFGSAVGLQFFLKNDYSIQFVFSFLYINMIIAFGFLASNFFWDVKTATVAGYLYVFGSGLLGGFFFENFVVDPQTSRRLVLGLEIIPAFATYRGLYEFSQYSFTAVYANTNGMGWKNLKDSKNGLSDVFVILFMEWMIFMILSIYLDIVAASESGVNKHPLFFLQFFFRRKMKGEALFGKEARVMTHINPEDDRLPTDRPDVAREKKLVQELRSRPDKLYSIICDNLKRVYPAKDGNPPKHAVRTFSLAVARGECVGILGPNGAGKTSSINMMIGFLKPTAGTAYIQGMNILTEMSRIYSCMGVCPQHDLLWGQLTAREHLLFYGRLKNLSREELNDAVETSLKRVNLFDNRVGDKQCRKYSGGMKRRLSVAISLIGNPQVVYMDEPSTGLDPASRYNLWSVVKDSKQNRAIILTTHSMEEAEALCDRVGIFVNGELQCVGNAKELRSRFGGLYVLTITTPQEEEAEVIALANNLSKNAKKVYGLAGTQKFELPKTEVSVADVFLTMEQAKQRLHIQAWGLTDTTLEDVFIKVSKAGGSVALS